MSMRSIYRRIARKNGVSVKEVREEMQRAINSSWNNPEKTAQNIAMQRSIRPDGEIPTSEELIQYCASQVKKNQ